MTWEIWWEFWIKLAEKNQWEDCGTVGRLCCMQKSSTKSFATEWMMFVREFMGQGLRGGQQGNQASHASQLLSRLGLHKKSWGDRARTAEASWPEGHSIPYDIVLSNKYWGKRKEGNDIWCHCVWFPSNVHETEPCFPGNHWTPAGPWEAVN